MRRCVHNEGELLMVCEALACPTEHLINKKLLQLYNYLRQLESKAKDCQSPLPNTSKAREMS